MPLLSEIIHQLEQLAPPSLQESYDNSGLITGDLSKEITGALICLDSTEEIIEEAIRKNCNLVIAHHPIIFKGLKKITGENYIERVIIKAIREGIAIYAIHPGKGTLTNVGYQSTFGNHPRNFTLDPTGKFLLVANMLSNSIVVFKRDVQTGLLSKVSMVEGIPSPSCLKVRAYRNM